MKKQTITPKSIFLFLLVMAFLESHAQLPVNRLKSKVKNWNEAHNSHSFRDMLNVYAKQVFFYGLNQSNEACAISKNDMYKDMPDYAQQVVGGIKVEALGPTRAKCSFIKRVNFNNKTKDYPAYLIFTKTRESDWKIDTESDLITDKNLSKKKAIKSVPDDAVLGDYNGDGKQEYMWLEKPVINEEEMNCSGDCTSYIRFSNPSIETISLPNTIGGTLHNYGDLNGNKTDEFGIYPYWFTSCWRSYYLYTYLNGKWEYAVNPIKTHCNQWESYPLPVEKDLTRPGYVIIHYSEFEDDIVLKRKIERVRTR